MINIEDSKIIELFFARDEAVIHAVSSKYGPVLHKTAANFLRDLRDREECVNDTYLAAWNTIPPQRPDPLVSYLCRIVRNLSIKCLRAKTAAKRNSAYDVALDELANCLPSASTAETGVEAKELAEYINRFLSTLDERKRVIFLRRYWFCDSVSAIASLLGVGNHYVSVHLNRMRMALHKYLTDEGVEL